MKNEKMKTIKKNLPLKNTLFYLQHGGVHWDGNASEKNLGVDEGIRKVGAADVVLARPEPNIHS